MNELIQGAEGPKYTDWPGKRERWRKWIVKKRKVGGQPGAHSTGQIEAIRARDRMISLPKNTYDAELVEMLELALGKATCPTWEHSHPDCQEQSSSSSRDIFLCFYVAFWSPAEFKSSCVTPNLQTACVHTHTHTHGGREEPGELEYCWVIEIISMLHQNKEDKEMPCLCSQHILCNTELCS